MGSGTGQRWRRVGGINDSVHCVPQVVLQGAQVNDCVLRPYCREGGSAIAYCRPYCREGGSVIVYLQVVHAVI